MTKKITPTKLFKVSKALIKSVDANNHTVDALVSTDAVDRDGEIILKTAWANGLKEYMAHPVLLSSHDYYDLRKQIGKALSVQMTEDGLVCKFQYFVGEGNEEADWAFNLASKGIAAYSVGFMGMDWMDGEYDKGIGRIFTNVNLLEVSQVLIPCNPEALQRTYKDPVSKELVEMAAKAFKWEAPAAKTFKITKSKIKSVKKDCIEVEITIDNQDGSTSDLVVPVQVDESMPLPTGPGLPDYMSQPALTQMMMDTNRACLKEHLEEVKKMLHDVCAQYYTPKEKHYLEFLLKDQPLPSGTAESMKETKEKLQKTIKESFQK